MPLKKILIVDDRVELPNLVGASLRSAEFFITSLISGTGTASTQGKNTQCKSIKPVT